MRTSISTTSGCSRRASSTASRAVRGLADDLDVGLRARGSARKPGADERLVVGEQRREITPPRQRQRARTRSRRRRAGRPRARRRRARRARACRRGRGPAPSRRAPAPSPSSTTSTSSASRLVAHAHLASRAPGVLERVRERLLDDPVRRQVEARRQRRRLALERELDRQPGRAHLLDERVELARGRAAARARRRSSRAQHAEQPPHARRAPARPVALDRAQRVARPRRVALEQRRSAASAWTTITLTRVRDDVVQLARDPGALLATAVRARSSRSCSSSRASTASSRARSRYAADDAADRPRQADEERRRDQLVAGRRVRVEQHARPRRGEPTAPAPSARRRSNDTPAA